MKKRKLFWIIGGLCLLVCAGVAVALLLPAGPITLEVGLRTDGLEANGDVVLYSVFEDKATLDAYQDHPDHMAVKAQVKPMCSSRTVLDYAA